MYALSTFPNMTPTSIFFTLIVIIFLPIRSIQGSATINPYFIQSLCVTQSGNFINGSDFQQNLKTVLSTLSTTSSSSPFSETSSGDPTTPSHVYGRYYCRHDLSLPVCSSCVHSATAKIASDCPTSKHAFVFFEQCTLLYLNDSSRIDSADTPQPTLSLYEDKKNVSDPVRFYPVFMSTMNRIINESAYGPDLFATAEAEVLEAAFGPTLYSLAQCSWDLEGVLCERCLRRALHFMLVCCKESTSQLYFYTNCQLRYSVGGQPFYDLHSSPTPPSAPTTSRESSSQSPPGNGAVARSCSNILKIIGVFMAITTLM